jgi:hypothetical protein
VGVRWLGRLSAVVVMVMVMAKCAMSRSTSVAADYVVLWAECLTPWLQCC